MHSAGQAAANYIKNFGKLIARSSWYDDFNPAANRSPLVGQLADSKPHRFWYYRLQNSMISSLPEDELVDPVLDGDLPEGPLPVLPKPQKPQISTYAALPTALFGMSENLRDLFIHEAQLAGSDGRPNLFISGYRIQEQHQGKAHRQNGESRYYGWQMGARWVLTGDEQKQLALSLGVNKGQQSLVPETRDGNSSSRFDTQGVNAMLSWQQHAGWQLAMPFGVSHYRGRISSDKAGDVAQMKATLGHVGLDGGWRWPLGAHAITPVTGVTAQWLNINDIRDQDGLHAHYHQQTQWQFSGGVKYQFSPTDTVKLGMDTRYVQYSANAGQVKVSNEGDFTTARSGNNLRYSGYVDWQITEDIALNSQLKMQQRLGQEGVSNWQAQIGVRIAF